MKHSFEKQLQEAKEKEDEERKTQMLFLNESNENLKILLNNAEKKYVHLVSLNNELQKRIDQLEQQKYTSTEQLYFHRFSCDLQDSCKQLEHEKFTSIKQSVPCRHGYLRSRRRGSPFVRKCMIRLID